jgi:catechol 2,3-dioxygenase-like lactoylglutathione lyase family enzyme
VISLRLAAAGHPLQPNRQRRKPVTYRLHQLHLICRDLEKMIGFFTEALGARLTARKQFGGADGAELDLQGTNISLRLAKEGEEIDGDASRTRYGFDHLGLQVEDLEEAMRDLAARGVEFITSPADLGDKIVVFLKGPEKITLELLQLK